MRSTVGRSAKGPGNSSGHLRVRDLADRRDGTLPAAQHARVEEHLAGGCADCTRLDASVRGLLDVMSEGPLPEPPRAAVRAAVRLFRARKWAWLLDAPGRIVASLVLDHRMELVPALRSAGGAERRMLWMVGRHELAASLVVRGQRAEIRGQMLPADDDGASPVVGEVEALCGGRSVARAPFDTDGNFALPNLPYGTYALLGRIGAEEFVVAPLEVGEA